MKFTELRLLPTLLLIAILTTSISARIYDRRELARALLSLGVSRSDIPMWICIAFHESRLDSNAINRCNSNGSWDHGLWQINDAFWVGRDRRGGACGFAASEVRGENLANAVRCVRHILEETQRFKPNGWMAWSVFNSGLCNGDLSSYVPGGI